MTSIIFLQILKLAVIFDFFFSLQFYWLENLKHILGVTESHLTTSGINYLTILLNLIASDIYIGGISGH